MARLNDLAWLPLCKEDIVAVTGDCQSLSGGPDEDWNGWPQWKKFWVGGNHDRPHTFEKLSRWTTRGDGPWGYNVGPLRFIGLANDPNDSVGWNELDYELRKTRKRRSSGINSVVVLSHYAPPLEDIVRGLRGMRELQSVLVLHGHAHAGVMGKVGTEWEEDVIAGMPVFRSHVYSAASQRRGCAHRIEWDDGRYSCTQVRVEVRIQSPRTVRGSY